MSDYTETFELSQPITTHNGPVQTLTLKEPTARLFTRHGEPFSTKVIWGDDGKVADVEFVFKDNKKVLQFLADMTGVDDVLLESMPARDFLQVRQLVAKMITLGVGGKDPTALSGS